MTEHRICSLCIGSRMVMTTDGKMISCPACSTTFTPSQLDPGKVDAYIDQCSISANIATVEPVVKISRSEAMKRAWIDRKAKAAEVKA